MKKLLTVTATFLFSSAISAQVNQEWAQTYSGGNLAPWNKGMTIDNSGNIYLAGKHFNGSTTSMLLQKYDGNGNLIWTENYLPAGSTNASARAMVADANGDIIISGVINNTTNIGFTRKYDPNGQLLWSQSTNFSNYSVTTDEMNNVYVTSWDMYEGAGAGLKIIKYSSAGNLLWTATNNSSIFGGSHGKLFYKAGFLYRTGAIWLKAGKKNIPVMYTIKYNASTGSQVWARTYHHADMLSQGGWDLVADAAGNVYILGYVYNKAGSNQNSNWVTVKYNSAGTQQWVVIYDGNGNDNSSNGFSDTPIGLTMDNSGNIIAVGSAYITTGSFSSHDMVTIKYNSSGAQLWVRTYDSPAHGSDIAKAVTTDTLGNVYVTGSLDAATFKYSSSGMVQWLANYSGGSTGNIHLDNNGHVYTGGTTAGGSVLIKYSQSSLLALTRKAE